MVEMSIVELPGLWIDHSDRDWAFSIQLLLHAALDQLNDASLALTLFEEAWIEAPDLAGNHSGSPESWRNRRLVFLHARSFVYAFDGMVQLLRVISRMPNLPGSAKDFCDRFEAEFGHCRKIRNSFQHIEDRIRALGPGEFRIPATILVIGGFIERRFGATTVDGTYSDIEVSASPIALAVNILTDVLWSFDWLGPGNQRVKRGA